MKSPHFVLIACAGALAWSSASFVQEPEESAALAFRPVEEWNTLLPNEKWRGIHGMIPIAHDGEEGFLVVAEEYNLAVDTDGNGKCDEDVKGQGGFLTLSGHDAAGERLQYAVRIRAGGSGWEYACSGVARGKVRGVEVSIVDQNNNGRWNDVGEDAMFLGKAAGACFLSQVVNLKGELYEMEVSADGRSAVTRPYAGPRATLNLAASFDAQGELITAVMRSSDERYSFEFAGEKHGLAVPTGSYVLENAFGRKGAETVRGRAGRMKAVFLEEGENHLLQWGAPVSLEFTYAANSADQITVQIPTFYGAAGEEWYGFQPDAKSPKIYVLDEKGKELWSGQFGGC
jgi:hypothetical protein